MKSKGIVLAMIGIIFLIMLGLMSFKNEEVTIKSIDTTSTRARKMLFGGDAFAQVINSKGEVISGVILMNGVTKAVGDKVIITKSFDGTLIIK